MKSSPSACLLWLTAVCSGLSNAYKFQVTSRLNRDNEALGRRGNLQGDSPLQNSADISYYANITLGGVSFSVLIDTGSADLWVAGTVPGATDSGKTSGVTYAIGDVSGPVKFGDLQFAGFEIKDAAYLEITPDRTNKEGKGLIGLGPASGSNIFTTLSGTKQGAPVLDRIFLQNTSTPNYLTVNLGRLEDPTDIFGGDLSIGETLDGLDAVLNQPKLPVTIVPVRQAGDQHFQVLLDQNGFIGPDGQPIAVTTEVSGAKNPNQLTAVVDTGFSLTQVPRALADGVYSRFDGSEFVNVTGIGPVWIVPCDLEVNMTLKFGGVSYPVHPMDATLKPSIVGLSGVVNSDGKESCIGTFQPIVFDRGSNPTYDIILGMSFVRNTYALFDHGDFVADSTTKRGDPYLQLLSTTNSSNAHSDFVSVRLNGDDTTGTQKLNPVRASGNSPPAKTSPTTIFKQVKPIYLILGVAAVAAALLISVFACCICRRRRSAAAYKPLHDPAPMKMGMMPQQQPAPYINNATYAQPVNQPFPTQPLYDPPTYSSMQAQYPTPWDSHRH